MAVPDTTFAQLNKIIEAASETINNVILAIAPDPPDRPRDVPYRADWAERYEAIEDLNVITAKAHAEYLTAPQEESDRYPYLGFVIDELRRDPEEYGEECFTASLGAIIGVQGETFPLSQFEMHEIHHAVNSILHLDKSLGEISGMGGQIIKLRFDNFADPIFDRVHMKNPWMTIQFNYQIWFLEKIYR